MDGDLQAEFTINSNQIVINSVLKENIKEDEIINVYFESPLDLGRGGMGLDWDNFSRIRRIGYIKIKSERDLVLNWIGFYTNNTREYKWVSKPDFYKNSGKIDFHRCGN
ncbi:hypothetical protein GCT19_15015 [Paraburkholderia sp. CNPSo 3155]|uniref:hypothetical protein n=1 Tax=Paraburkholderia atlantica TaxID=2654982 RepID=UPI00128D2DCD|nr:hypothetical protein [Paraburkholderia atlantica]MPW06947.1 hypothetical protein [Paraburkholderia atlantica]